MRTPALGDVYQGRARERFPGTLELVARSRLSVLSPDPEPLRMPAALRQHVTSIRIPAEPLVEPWKQPHLRMM